MADLGMVRVLNARYSPDLNPIEGVFSVVKRQIKTMRLKALVKGQANKIEEMIDEPFMKVKKEVCIKNIKRS